MAYKFVGYFGNWAQYRQAGGKFFPDQIDPSLFTHVCFAFAMLGFVSWSVDPSPDRTGEQRYTGDYKIQPVEWNDEEVLYPAMQALKQKNPNLKTLLSIGGWSFNSCDDTPESAGTKYPYGPFTCQLFSKMAADPGGRTQFIQSAIEYAKKYGFDGIDLDWEYPAVLDRGGQDADYANYLALLQEFRQTAGPDFLITLASAAVPKGSKTGDSFFQWMAECAQYLDWFNVMSYDYHGAFDDPQTVGTGVNAPLLKDSVPNGTFCVKDTVEAYLKANIPKEKIVLGMGTYGRSYVVEDRTDGYGKPFSGAGPAGAATATPGILSYFEILEKIANGELDVQRWDEPTLTPYAYSTKTGLWVSYDDEKSLGYKVSYLIEKELGGGMIWAIDLDDFGKGFPLSKAIKGILDNPDSRPPLEIEPEPKPEPEPDPEQPDVPFPWDLVREFPIHQAMNVQVAQSLQDATTRGIGGKDSFPIGLSGAPALANYNGSLYCVHQQQDRDPRLRYFKFGVDGAGEDIPIDAGTFNPPALAVYKGKLYCVHEGTTKAGKGTGWVWACTFDGQNWSKDEELPFRTGSSRQGFPSVALAEYKGLLYCVHESTHGTGELWYATFDGEKWSEDTNMHMGTTAAPALIVLNDRLFCLHEGKDRDGKLWYTSFDGKTWSRDILLQRRSDLPSARGIAEDFISIAGSPAILLDPEPRLLILHQGVDNHGLWSVGQEADKHMDIFDGAAFTPAMVMDEDRLWMMFNEVQFETTGRIGLYLVTDVEPQEPRTREYNLEMPERPNSPYNPLGAYNTALTERSDLSDANHPVNMTRHHIIPDNRLRDFWNRMLRDGHFNAANALLSVFESNLGQYQMNLAQINELRELLQGLQDGSIRHNSEAVRPEAFDDLAALYEWMPGNLFIGPTGGGGQYQRTDDPGSDFEENAGAVIGNRDFRVRQDANAAIEAYLGSGDRSAAQRAIIGLAAMARRNSPYDVNPTGWIFKSGKYHLNPDHDEL